MNNTQRTMKTQHTPGPWETNRQSGITYVWQGGTSNAIAKVYVDVNEDSEANARRIVECVNACEGISDPNAVPELLDALRLALIDLEQAQRETDIDFRGSIDAVRAVIAKATGTNI